MLLYATFAISRKVFCGFELDYVAFVQCNVINHSIVQCCVVSWAPLVFLGEGRARDCQSWSGCCLALCFLSFPSLKLFIRVYKDPGALKRLEN